MYSVKFFPHKALSSTNALKLKKRCS